MSYSTMNNNLMYIQMSALKRPKPPTTSNSPRALGTPRGVMNKADAYEMQRTVSEAKTKPCDGNPASKSLRLKDIAKFDLMSPYAVQRLTGSYRSSFPTVAGGAQQGHVKMLNIQLPTNPYSALPKLAMTKAPTGNDAYACQMSNLTRSQSELSLYKQRDSAHQERPHTEGRMTRSRAHEASMLFPILKPVAEKDVAGGDYVPLKEGNQSEDDETTNNHSKESTLQSAEEGINDASEVVPSLKVMLTRHRVRQLSRQGRRATPSRHARVVSASGSASSSKTPRASAAERMSDLTMSEYTEVHASNRGVDGRVWGGVGLKPKTAPENGSRTVRFNITNDVFEYRP